MAEPIDKELYNRVKQMASTVFKSPTGAYRSMWIVKKYKELGGKYRTKKTNSKLDRWLDEKWIDLNNPILKNNKIIGYNKCGSKNTQNNLYPLCRPSKKISIDTPLIYQNINQSVIDSVNKQKQILRNRGNIKF